MRVVWEIFRNGRVEWWEKLLERWEVGSLHVLFLIKVSPLQGTLEWCIQHMFVNNHEFCSGIGTP